VRVNRNYLKWFTTLCLALVLLVLPGAGGRSSAAAADLLTGVHWGSSSDLTTFKAIGYDFDITTVSPNDPAQWRAKLNAAQASGLKLIIGAYPEPYSYNSATGQWTISAAGINFLNYLASRSSLVMAVFVYNEPYWVNPVTGENDPCGAVSAAQLRALRATIQAVWSGAKIYHDIGAPSAWAPGGSLYESHSCIGDKYADPTGVADYVGIWDYPFTTSGYARARALDTLARESTYVVTSMHATPVWLNQSHACSGCDLVFPTQAQILDWNCATRRALPPGSLIAWHVWRQGMYEDYLANHPEHWSSTTAAACAPDASQPVRSALTENHRLSRFVLWNNRIPVWAQRSTRGSALARLRAAAVNRGRRGIRLRVLSDRFQVLSIRFDQSRAHATVITRERKRIRRYGPSGTPAGRPVERSERLRIVTMRRLGATNRFVVWSVKLLH
jgi:hypothetical protein